LGFVWGDVITAALGVGRPRVAERGGGAVLSALRERSGRVYARFYEHRGRHAHVAFNWMGTPATMIEVNRRLGRLGTGAQLGPWADLDS
jgi:hypothetical protein